MKPGILAMTLAAAVILARPQTAPPAAPAFELVSIKPHAFDGTSGRCGPVSISGSRVTVPCVSVRNLILRAYGVKLYQISGGPRWLSESVSPAYDITGRTAGDVTPTMEQVPQMLQALLAERFQLKVHRETKELPVYALVAGKGGPKLQESAADAKASFGFTMGGMKGSLTAVKESMPQLALYLSNEAGRPVLDQTGLTGNYDLKLTWARDQVQRIAGVAAAPSDPAAAASDPAGASLFTALQEQLGLKLDPRKAPIDLLVVEHVEAPTEN